MIDVTIRNLDDSVVEALAQRARDHRRSLEAEMRDILGSAARYRSRAEFVAIMDRIAAMTPNVPQSNSTDLVREDRDR
jgi:plasmid stability protein